jgi:tetratricopeptide (TPR) repeat protein
VRECAKIVDNDARDLGALHKLVELELELGSKAKSVGWQVTLAERLLKRGWKLTALFRFRRLFEAVQQLDPAERAMYRAVPQRMEALRAEIGLHRDTLADYDEAARALESKGRDNDALELTEKMITLEPDNPVFHARLAEALCRLGRTEQAIPAFSSAADALIEFERATDALRVLERILHFKNSPDDALTAANLYLERGQPKDAVRAVAKLQMCIAADPENLDALLLLGRAFDSMGQPARAVQVRVEMARVAREADESELYRQLVSFLKEVASEDPAVGALSEPPRSADSSAPALSYRSSVASVVEEDLELVEEDISEADSVSESSVLEEFTFEDMSTLSEEWLMPVISKEARRALDEAEAFSRLKLHAKAAYVLRNAVEEDPVTSELREALRAALRAMGDKEGFLEETLMAADLYRQRGFVARARTLVDEVLALDPTNPEAHSIDGLLDEWEPSGARADVH